MDASTLDSRQSFLEWDESDVHAWFTKLGLPQYENQIRREWLPNRCYRNIVSKAAIEHNITGEVLCLMDTETLKDVGIATIGQRLAILKGVYNIKLAQNIPIEPEHYMPPCEYQLQCSVPASIDARP